MGRDTGLAERARRKGLVTVDVAGWLTRGADNFDPDGSGNHHTAGSPNGVAPSLGTCVNGRGGPHPVPGPLCNVLQGRHAFDGLLDPMYIIASGTANHGGQGSWAGISGNSHWYGLEVEHVGTGPVDARRLEASARMHAAFFEALDNPDPYRLLWQHFQYALPPGRKIDFFNLWPWTPLQFIDTVAWWIGRDADDLPTDPTPDPEDDDMAVRKIPIVPGGDLIVETYAYLLGDGTLVDTDHNGGPIDANDAKKFDAILLKDPAVAVNKAQIDQVESAIGMATRRRLGTD